MRTAYQYRLRPTSSQVALMSEWLKLLRRQYNHRLGERFSWYEQNRCDVNACPLICHRSLSRKKKGSNRRKKAIQRVAKAHLNVANQRKDFHYKVAKKLLSKRKHVAHEKLNIRGIARSKLAKSTHDAGWGQFLQILAVKAERAGLPEFAVNPSGTSQNCSGCGVKVPKTLQDRLHTCPECGLTIDRGHNAAINIKYLAVGHSVNKAQETPNGLPGVTEKPAPDPSVSV